MLEGNDRISKNEHRAFFAVAFGMCVLRIFELTISFVFPEAIAVPRGVRIVYGTISWREDLLSPIYSVVVFLLATLFICKLTTIRILMAAFFLLLLVVFFFSWFLDAQQAIALAIANQTEAGLVEYNPVLGWGSYYDVISLVSAIILLGWTLTILTRTVRTGRRATH